VHHIRQKTRPAVQNQTDGDECSCGGDFSDGCEIEFIVHKLSEYELLELVDLSEGEFCDVPFYFLVEYLCAE